MISAFERLARPQPAPGETDDDPGLQYGLVKLLAIWAAATAPMPILAFIVAPALAPEGGWQQGLTVWLLLIGGMIWQFLLSVWLLWREGVPFTRSALKRRLWLQTPRDPRTGRRSWRLLWWLIPAAAFYVAVDLTAVGEAIGRLILWPFPFVAGLPRLELSGLMVPDLVGAWWLVPVALTACLFNYLLGEELLFRGVLLPKMRGVFGRWDWVANSVFFGLYHLHRPLMMLGFVLSGLALTMPARRFRSIWFSIILHGAEGLPVIAGAIAVAAGLGL